MTWIFAQRAVVAALLCTALSGCAPGGFIGPRPLVSDPARAANVTFFRDGSLVGFAGAIHVKMEGRDLMRLRRNQSFSFSVDPGEYMIDYSIGFNECRNTILVRSGMSYRFRLAPNCSIFEGWY